MVAKVNGAIEAGSFIGHEIEHFSIGGVRLDRVADAAAATWVMETIETRATIVMIGALGDGSASGLTEVAVETPNGWTAALLQTALRSNGVTAYTAAAFTY